MTNMDILKHRLFNHGLSCFRFQTPAEVVDHFGALQAQDFGAATWSLGRRIKNAGRTDIENAYNQGQILRVHTLRPTWHFVLPRDIRWLQKLTGSRIKARLSPYNRKLELDDALFTKSNSLIVRHLQKSQYLTRQELKAILAAKGIQTNVQRLAHIISWAELDGLICSGPLHGKQFTYALLDERAPKTKNLSQQEAMASLALAYFRSHGPAQQLDFSWWSGMTARLAGEAMDLIKSKLEHVIAEGKDYWFIEQTKVPAVPAALLLSIYDEYTIAYKDRSDLSAQRDIERMIGMGNALTAVMILKGKVVGSWNKSGKIGNEIKLKPFKPLGASEEKAFKSEAARFGRFQLQGRS